MFSGFNLTVLFLQSRMLIKTGFVSYLFLCEFSCALINGFSGYHSLAESHAMLFDSHHWCLSISVCNLVGLLAITDKRVFVVVVVGGGGGGFFVVVVVAFFQCNINPLRHCDLFYNRNWIDCLCVRLVSLLKSRSGKCERYFPGLRWCKTGFYFLFQYVCSYQCQWLQFTLSQCSQVHSCWFFL